MFIAFLVILVDMIGLGIMVPIFAFYVLQFDAGPGMATLLMSLYILAMFITTPILGRLSDLYGRKPVMMVSMFGASLGYLALAFATNLWWVAFARLLSGAMAGNIATAQAYITDITSEENRAKGMGIIGAAFGLGFIIGPAIGSYLAGTDFESANLMLPAIVAGGLSFVAFLLVMLILPESLTEENRLAARNRPVESRFDAFKKVLNRHLIFQIIVCAFVLNMTGGLFETLFPIWASDIKGGVGLVEGPRGLIPYLLVGGLTIAVVQGGLIGKLSRRFGEHTLLQAGAILYALSLVGLTLSGEWLNKPLIFFFMATVSAASAIVMTSTQSLVSMCAEGSERGLVMGVYNSVGTMGRFLGTLVTGFVFYEIFRHAPYWMGAILMMVLWAYSLSMKKQWELNKDTRAEKLG